MQLTGGTSKTQTLFLTYLRVDMSECDKGLLHQGVDQAAAAGNVDASLKSI